MRTRKRMLFSRNLLVHLINNSDYTMHALNGRYVFVLTQEI